MNQEVFEIYIGLLDLLSMLLKAQIELLTEENWEYIGQCIQAAAKNLCTIIY